MLNPEDFQPYAMPFGDLSPPPPGVVQLWYLDLQELGNPLQADAVSSPARMSMRQQRTLRRFYLRLLLGAYLGVPGKDVHISRLVKGKPVLSGIASDRMLDFSISNSDACCLIGICNSGMLGVDMERSGRRTGNPKGLARRYFSAHESAALEALGPEEADRLFLHTWACKEALVKGAGHGIANQLCRFTVSCASEPRVLEMEDDDPAAWRLVMVRPSERHIGAVALRHPEISLESFRLVLQS